MNSVGISVYISNGLEKNIALLKRSLRFNIDIVFTSLQIPEENASSSIKQIQEIATFCKIHHLSLCADISNSVLEKFAVQSLNELYLLGFTHLRMDYGFDVSDIKDCTRTHNVMINASTITSLELEKMKQEQIDFTHIIALHNFYPKAHTGLTIDFVKKQNELLHEYGIKTLSFIPGHKTPRAPLYEFLPTIEKHRNQCGLLSAMESMQICKSDGIIIGDIEEDKFTMQHLLQIVQGVFVLPCTFTNEIYGNLLKNRIHEDRFDYSRDTIRIQGTRLEKQFRLYPQSVPYQGERHCGTIFVSNDQFLRYCNEIEIARVHLEYDNRVNCIGMVDVKYHSLLQEITSQSRFIIV